MNIEAIHKKTLHKTYKEETVVMTNAVNSVPEDEASFNDLQNHLKNVIIDASQTYLVPVEKQVGTTASTKNGN